MPVASKRARRMRRLKRQNTLLFRALGQQHAQLEQASVLIAQMTNALQPPTPPASPEPVSTSPE